MAGPGCSLIHLGSALLRPAAAPYCAPCCTLIRPAAPCCTLLHPAAHPAVPPTRPAGPNAPHAPRRLSYMNAAVTAVLFRWLRNGRRTSGQQQTLGGSGLAGQLGRLGSPSLCVSYNLHELGAAPSRPRNWVSVTGAHLAVSWGCFRRFKLLCLFFSRRSSLIHSHSPIFFFSPPNLFFPRLFRLLKVVSL